MYFIYSGMNFFFNVSCLIELTKMNTLY